MTMTTEPTTHVYPTFTATDVEIEGWKNDTLECAVRCFVESVERSKSDHVIVNRNGPTHVRLRMALDAAARIVAERAASAPTDEAIARIIINCDDNLDCLFGDDPGIDQHYLEVARKVRAALQPAPVMDLPEGWHLESICDCQEELDGEVTKTYYVCTIYNDVDSREGTGDTWQEALAAAIAEAAQ